MEENFEILLIDDDIIIQKLHHHILKKRINSPIKTFSNGLEAKEYLDQNFSIKRNYLIFLDINMPYMNGWEFLEYCQAKYPNAKIQVVILTSSPFKKDQIKASSYKQVLSYKIKPLYKDHIIEILTSLEVSCSA